MQEEFLQLDDNIVSDVNIDCAPPHDNSGGIVNSNDDNNRSNWCHGIRVKLGMDNSWESLRDDPCPLYFVSLLTLIYFPIGLLVMPLTCCGYKLDPNTQPRKVTAYKFMMISTLLRIGLHLILLLQLGPEYSLYAVFAIYPC